MQKFTVNASFHKNARKFILRTPSPNPNSMHNFTHSQDVRVTPVFVVDTIFILKIQYLLLPVNLGY